MTTAKTALEELSRSPRARRLASEREMARVGDLHVRTSCFEQGHAEGQTEGLLVAVRSLSSVLGIVLDDAKSGQLAKLDVAGLTALVKCLETERRWPEG
jgi:hypothetical protein